LLIYGTYKNELFLRDSRRFRGTEYIFSIVKKRGVVPFEQLRNNYFTPGDCKHNVLQESANNVLVFISDKREVIIIFNTIFQ